MATMLSTISMAVIAASSDGPPWWLLALGPAGAGAFYAGMWSYYRNAHQSHSYERETRVEAQPVTGSDTKVQEVKGVRRGRVEGENHTEHRQRVSRFQ